MESTERVFVLFYLLEELAFSDHHHYSVSVVNRRQVAVVVSAMGRGVVNQNKTCVWMGEWLNNPQTVIHFFTQVCSQWLIIGHTLYLLPEVVNISGIKTVSISSCVYKSLP